MRNILTVIFIILLLSFVGYSQAAPGKFGIFAGLSLPQGEFADDDFEHGESGFAQMGFCVGAEYVKPLNSPGLNWVTSLSLIFNSLDADPIAKEMGEDADEDISGDAGMYMNIPLMTGVSYQGAVSPTMQAFGLAQIGFNYMKVPTIELSSDEVTAEAEFDSQTSFGFGIGGGVIINNKFTIELRYLTFGEQDLKGTIDLPEEAGEDIDIDEEMSLSMILLTVGIALGGN